MGSISTNGENGRNTIRWRSDSTITNNFGENGTGEGEDEGEGGAGRRSDARGSVASGDGGGGGGGSGGGFEEAGGGDENDELMSSALQSIAQALTQMQEAMRAMSNKMEKTDDCVRCVADRLKSHGQTVERLSNRMCGLENKAAAPGRASSSGRCRSGPASQGVCPPASLRLGAPPPADPCAPAAATCCDDRAAFLGRHLLRAAQNGSRRCVKRLLAAGADVNFCYGSKWTPLHLAAAKGRARVLATLLRRCADVHARNCYGFSALHIAAYHDYSGRCAAVLLAAGADPDARNRSGRTPLHYAAEAGNVQAARALRNAGASMCAKDDEGHTPYDVAQTVSVRRLLRPCSRGLRKRPAACHGAAAPAQCLG